MAEEALRYKDKVTIVTGGSRGIGRGIVEVFGEYNIQSTLVISKSKGPAETLRDIRTSTYQMCRIEENTKRTTKISQMNM